jgi:transcriptional regulator with XRE-family HTH domain
VQKYEKGINRIGSSRLQEISEILGVSVPFFFEGLPSHLSGESRDDLSTDLTQQLASAGGLDLAKGFQRIRNQCDEALLRLLKSWPTCKVRVVMQPACVRALEGANE